MHLEKEKKEKSVSYKTKEQKWLGQEMNTIVKTQPKVVENSNEMTKGVKRGDFDENSKRGKIIGQWLSIS